MEEEKMEEIKPHYKGYTGDIEFHNGKFIVTGKYEILDIDDGQLEITELPIGKWTRDYKTFLEGLAQKDEIEEIREYHKENRVHFVITVPKLAEIERKEGILSKFKLQNSISISNMVMFDAEGKLDRYKGTHDIIHEWFKLRENCYDMRKAHQLAKLKKECETLKNRVRFIKAVIEDEINIKRVKR